MKTVKARPLTVRYMLTIALCAAVGARLTAQEEVPVAELLEEAAPAAAAAEAPAADPAPAAEAPAAEPVVAEAAVPEVEAVPAPEPEPVAEVAAPAPAAVEAPAPVAEAAPAGNGNGKTIVTVDDKNELMDSSSYDSGKITVALDGIPLADVVQLFTRLSGANIICNATNLQGTVTANLDNVDWEPAFRAILERQGLLLTEDPMNKGIFSIDPKSPDAPEPWVTETFKLSYLKANDAAEMLYFVQHRDESPVPIHSRSTGATLYNTIAQSMRVPPAQPDSISHRQALTAGIRRLGRGGGTAFPGLVATRIDPRILDKLAARLPQGAMVVAGTNGKTTSSRMLANVLQSAGLDVVHNRSGSNLSGSSAVTSNMSRTPATSNALNAVSTPNHLFDRIRGSSFWIASRVTDHRSGV